MIVSLFRYAPVQIFSAISVFALIILQTKYLEPENYGLLTVVMIVLELVRMIGTQWLNVSMLRLMPVGDVVEKKEIEDTTLLLMICGCLIGFLIIILGLKLYGILSWKVFGLLSCLLVFKSYYQYCLEVARLHENVNKYKKAIVAQAALTILLSWYMLSVSPELNTAIIALLLSYVISSAIFKLPEKPVFNKNQAKSIMKYGLPVMISGGVALFSSRLDRLYVASLIGLGAAGVYAAQANFITGVLSLVFMVIAMPLYPDIIKEVKNNELLVKKHSQYLSLILMIGIPSVFGMLILSQNILGLFLGDMYLSKNDNLFNILLAAIFVSNIKAHYVDHGLQFLLLTKKLVWVSFVGLILNIVLIPILVKSHGVVGGASSLLFVNTFVLVLSAILSIKNGYKYSVSSDVIKVFLSAGLMAFFLHLTIIYFFGSKIELCDFALLIVAFSSFYFLFLYVLNFMNFQKHGINIIRLLG